MWGCFQRPRGCVKVSRMWGRFQQPPNYLRGGRIARVDLGIGPLGIATG